MIEPKRIKRGRLPCLTSDVSASQELILHLGAFMAAGAVATFLSLLFGSCGKEMNGGKDDDRLATQDEQEHKQEAEQEGAQPQGKSNVADADNDCEWCISQDLDQESAQAKPKEVRKNPVEYEQDEHE